MRITHLEERSGAWWFAFATDESETFEYALKRFKWTVPLALRAWHEEDKRWEVPMTEETQGMMERTFTNFASTLQTMRAQLTLF